MRMLRPWLLAASLALCALPGMPPAARTADAFLQHAIDGSWRSATNRARDRYRHPLETLQLFGLRPEMTVIELDPGGGWYTEILAPALHDRGHLIEAAPPVDAGSPFMRRMAAAFESKLRSDPAV